MARARDDLAVRAMPWAEFGPWFARQWKPGQHLASIGPTGVGKSTFAVGILPLRRWCLACDPKGGDDTLSALERLAGFERQPSWPPSRKVYQRIEEGSPVRLIVGPVVRKREDLPRLRSTIAEALGDAFDQGGWTVYIDELQITADPRMMGLAGSVEQLLIAARSKGVSVVSSFQRPANVPRAASDQARWVAVWYTRDVDVANRLAEMVGRQKAEIRGALRGLDEHALLLFSQNPNDPIIVTRPPRVS